MKPKQMRIIFDTLFQKKSSFKPALDILVILLMKVLKLAERLQHCDKVIVNYFISLNQ